MQSAEQNGSCVGCFNGDDTGVAATDTNPFLELGDDKWPDDTFGFESLGEAAYSGSNWSLTFSPE